jgi:hypothetical protein
MKKEIELLKLALAEDISDNFRLLVEAFLETLKVREDEIGREL